MTKATQGGGEPSRWQPGSRGTAKRRRREAEGLARRTKDRPELLGRARAASREARVAVTVAEFRPEETEPGGALPHGPARGNLEQARFREMALDPRTGRERVVEHSVLKRRGASVLARFPDHLRRTAERYAALVEGVSSPGGHDLELPRVGGVSDGGATRRVDLASRLRRAREAIGVEIVLEPQVTCNGGARQPITALELVDSVCLEGLAINGLLSRFGWSRHADHCRALRQALEAVLTRLADVV